MLSVRKAVERGSCQAQIDRWNFCCCCCCETGAATNGYDAVTITIIQSCTASLSKVRRRMHNTAREGTAGKR